MEHTIPETTLEAYKVTINESDNVSKELCFASQVSHKTGMTDPIAGKSDIVSDRFSWFP